MTPQGPNSQASRLVTSHSLLVTVLLTFHFSFLISTCGFDVEDPTPPSPPVWIQKSLPEEWPERGIDADELGGICLEWQPSQEEEVYRYYIYRATWYGSDDSLGDYVTLAKIDISEKSDHRFIDHLVVENNYYYYKLKSETQSGIISNYSDSVYYSLLPAIYSETMNPNGNNDLLGRNRALGWSYSNYNELEDFTITVLSAENILVIRANVFPTNYVGNTEIWYIPDQILLDSGMVYKWRVDSGANYLNFRETSGSESTWAKFMYVDDT